MELQGKKINELISISQITNETVLPVVYINGQTVNSSANKITIQQVSDKVSENMTDILSTKQDVLTAGENITIQNNVISANVPQGNFLTADNIQAGQGITVTEDSDDVIISAAEPEQSIINITSTSGTINLESNKIYKVELDGDTTFSLPSITDNTKLNQIFLQLQVNQSINLNLGTDNYMGQQPEILTGTYNIYYEYDANNEIWFAGSVTKTIFQREPSRLIWLYYPFTTYPDYLTNVTGGSYPFVIDSTTESLMSGSTSYNVSNGLSWGYLSFTTPNYNTLLEIKAYANSEQNYDFGACILSLSTDASLDGQDPTSSSYAGKIKNGTVYNNTSQLSANNPIIVFRSSGDNAQPSTAYVTLARSTTYYLHLIYKKDGSSDRNADRFYIKELSFTIPQN